MQTNIEYDILNIMLTEEQKINQAAKLLNESTKTLVITGAGISKASGLPTYRGIGGLYTGCHLLPPELVMSKFCFNILPILTWNKFYYALKRGKNIKPNSAHDALVTMNALSCVTILTQNVDGLHQEAGSDDVIEIHGSARSFSCVNGCFAHEKKYNPTGFVPKCKYCGGLVRPDVILFGEDLPSKALKKLELTLMEKFDLVITVGTTMNFGYIQQAALYTSAPIIDINPTPSKFSKHYANIQISTLAEISLMKIVNKAWELNNSYFK